MTRQEPPDYLPWVPTPPTSGAPNRSIILVRRTDGHTVIVRYSGNVYGLPAIVDLDNVSTPRWDDLRVPLEMAKPSTSPPDYAAFRGNLFAYLFSGSAAERVYFACQLPHSWQFGTTIRPHVHIGFPSAPVNGQTVRFILDYSIQSPMGGIFAAETSIQADYTIDTTKAYDAQYGHTVLELPAIDMTGHTASAMLLCRLSRDGSADTYNSDVACFEADFHFQADGFGTTSEWTGKP